MGDRNIHHPRNTLLDFTDISETSDCYEASCHHDLKRNHVFIKSLKQLAGENPFKLKSLYF
jgi:hypothetical protein